MADEIENHTLRLLQEMRQTMQELRSEVGEVRNRLDGNTLILNMIAGFVHDHEHRIQGLETARS